MPAIWKYYLDTSLFNLGFSILFGLYAGFPWALLVFASFGTLVGFLSFSYFREHEYYFYYNMGLTKRALMVRTWIINLVSSINLFGAYALIVTLFS
jgi:hypothetical protein